MVRREDFNSLVYPEPNTGCWLWAGRHDPAGYGRVSERSWGYQMVHRYSYALHKGDFDKNMDVLHKCDNRACVNPDHLYLGDQKQNNIDKKLRGRSGRCPGSKNGNSVLTEELVLDIRKKYADGNTTSRKLAREYDVSQYAVMCIIQRKHWKHI